MSHEPTRRTVLTATVERRHEADALTARPGDAVLVHRGRARSLVMACPDGCGERLTVNLDPEAGPAWRAYQTPRGLTLYPSVWRESGCKTGAIRLGGEIDVIHNYFGTIVRPKTRCQQVAYLQVCFRSVIEWSAVGCLVCDCFCSCCCHRYN